jgi:hypothetical protein
MDPSSWVLGGEDHRNDFDRAEDSWLEESLLCSPCRNALNNYYTIVDHMWIPIETAKNIDYGLGRSCELCLLVLRSLGSDIALLQVKEPQSYLETKYYGNQDLGAFSIVFYETSALCQGVSSSKNILHRSFDLNPGKFLE